MKYLYTLIISGFLIPFLPLSAETADIEEAELTSLEEELSLLDEEFEEFKEELFSLETELQSPENSSQMVIQVSDEEFETNPQLMETAASDQMAERQSLEFVMAPSPAAPTMEIKPLDKKSVIQENPATLTIVDEMSRASSGISIDLNQAFAGSPIIYTVLFAMSIIALCLWLYSIVSLRNSADLSRTLLTDVQNKLNSNQFDEALALCTRHNTLFCKMLASGIQSRRHGLPLMIESMKAEGKRASISFWQKLGLLNDIAIIAPMIGLLGTVLGMFYAFYDINRSIESISTLFDGLGISVGTTVAGLIVAILALILHSTAKYRLVRALAHVENEAQSLATLIDDRTSIYKG